MIEVVKNVTGNLGNIADPDRGERIAIVDLGHSEDPKLYTYKRLSEAIDRVASYLHALSLARGASVAILSLNRFEYVAAYLGIMKAGLVAVPVNIKLPPPTIDHILLDASVEFAFVDAANASLVGKIRSINFDDTSPDGFGAQIDQSSFTALEMNDNDIAQILYTSGSTGMPKGVPITHRGMLWALNSLAQPGLEDERQIVAQPLFHMNGLMVVKSVILNGSSIVVMPSFNARSYSEAIESWGVTRIFAVPTMMARVLKEMKDNHFDFSAVRHLTLSSAPVTEALVKKLVAVFPGAAVDVNFGCTEAGPRIFGQHPAGKPKPMLALGVPADGCEIKLVDGTDEQGVLVVRTPAVMTGYLNLPEKTAQVLHDGWYYSGDVMRRDSDQFYYFVGRADDMFVCSGENIYPGDVEKMLEKHPAIQQVAVVPLADEERGQMPIAFVVLRAGSELSVDELKGFAITNGPAYQHPRRVAFIEELPLAGTNKVDRSALSREAIARERASRWSD